MKWLKGKKTMIGSVLSGVLTIAFSLGLIDAELAGVIGGFLLTFTGVSLRLAVKGK